MAKTKKYTREAILASTLFRGYQRDFVSALLVKPEYTIPEAKKIVFGFFDKKEK